MTTPYSTQNCRLDLVKPVVIFGGVFLLSAAFCGAVDTMQSTSFAEEVKVVRAEGAAGGHDTDLLVACQHVKSSLLKDIRCRSQHRSTVTRH